MTSENCFDDIFVNARHPCDKYYFGYDSVLWLDDMSESSNSGHSKGKGLIDAILN